MAKKKKSKNSKESERRLEKKAEKDLDSAEKLSEKDEKIYHNKILRNIFVGIIIVVVIILAIGFFFRSASSFSYKGVHFDIVKSQATGPYLILYNTQVPVVINRTNTNYNFYLRNDPRKLEQDVPFIGNLSLRQNLVLNGMENFSCDGYGAIAIANMANLFKIEGINPITDPNATCDPQGRYTFIQLQNASNTSVVQTGPSCYDININNCEILQGTERLMIANFVKLHAYFNGTSQLFS